MDNKKYYITQIQLFQLQHFKRMFELVSHDIRNLCSEERADVVYGFELGKIHSDLRRHFIDFSEFEDELKEQQENGQ